MTSTASNHPSLSYPPVPRPVLRREIAGVSIPSQALTFSVRSTVKPVIDAWARAPHLPWPTGVVDRLAFPLKPVPGTHRHAVRLPSCRAEFLAAPGADGSTAILYLHGGAFLVCGLTTHRQMVSRISSAAGAPVLSVAYRMLPGHPIESAVEDGIEGLRWLIAHGYPAERIVVAGDSAGGFLTFQVTLEALRLGLGRPAGNVALSPLTDLDTRGKLAHPNSYRCALFPRRAVPALADVIARIDAAADGPGPRAVSPVDADLTAMPPTLIQTGSEEMTYVDAELMAARLAGAGVHCELQVWERQVHVFQAAAGIVPEAGRAVASIGVFVRSLR